MEGSSTHHFPRTELDKPVEIQIGRQTIRVETLSNNVSIGGIFVSRADLPVGSPVHVRIPVHRHHFEADGQIDTTSKSGAGIEFKSLSKDELENLYELIADLTVRGLAAA